MPPQQQGSFTEFMAQKQKPAATNPNVPTNDPNITPEVVQDPLTKLLPGRVPDPDEPSLWEKANTGIVPSNSIVKPAFGMSQDDLKGVRDADPVVGDNSPVPANLPAKDKLRIFKSREKQTETPGHSFARTFFAGTGSDAADVLSSFTSPLSAGTAVLGAASKVPNMLGRLARLGLTATGLGFGAQGAVDIADTNDGALVGTLKAPFQAAMPETFGQPTVSPEDAKKVLLGSSQVLAAAPALKTTAQTIASGVRRSIPNAFSIGETAFVKTLGRGTKNEIRARRAAYRTVQNELQTDKPSTLEDLHDWANTNRMKAANDLQNRILLRGQNISVDPVEVAQTGRNAITELMNAEKIYSQQNTGMVDAQGRPITRTVANDGARARRIIDYVNNVAENFARDPRSLVTAEKMVQDINAEQGKFYKMPQADQWRILHDNPEVMAKFAIKDALQAQLERAVGNYPDLKQKYGAFKEIQNQTNTHLNRLAVEQPNTNIGRRILETTMAGAGGAFGLHSGGEAGGITGGLMGYTLGKALGNVMVERLGEPNRLLNRSYKSGPSPTPFRHSAVGAIASGFDQSRENSNAPDNSTLYNDVTPPQKGDVPAFLQRAVKPAKMNTTTNTGAATHKFNMATGKIEAIR